MQQYFVKGQCNLSCNYRGQGNHQAYVSGHAAERRGWGYLVFDDGIKRLARVLDVEACQFELVQELTDNVELPVQVTIASGFPKGDKLEFITQKVTELGASQIWGFPADWSVAKWDGKKLGKKIEKLEKIALEQQNKASVISSQVFSFSRKKKIF